MEITLIAAFIGFFAMVAAWLAAPTDARRPTAAMVDPLTVGADNPAFARHLTGTVERAATLVPPASRPPPLRFAEPVCA